MKKPIPVYVALVIILTTSLACNIGRTAPGSPTAILEPGSGQVTPTLPAILEAGETAPAVSAEPLPSGYTDLLQDKIASGEWTQEEGLVTLLKMFVGEIPVSEAGLGKGVKETEGTGILRLAGGYLKTGSDQAAKDEITRLLNLLVPSQEALDRYSIPDDQSSGRGPGLAAPSRRDPVQCETLWTEGFPDERTPSFPCFLKGEQIIGGATYQVYFPLAWRGDASRNNYYRATLKAVQDSVAKYRPYGTLKSIYFVFTTLADEADTRDVINGAMTANGSFSINTEACPVIIFPAAMTVNVAQYKQLIAHEIFHCFQDWNLHEQVNGPGADSFWWVEGTAEYFSNLVYPAVNAEHAWAADFSGRSTTEPLTNMAYENFAFFQFMGNSIGPPGVIDLLGSMPTTPGLDAQLAALAAIPGMEDTFEEFVRSLLDYTLKDSDGSVIVFPENFTGEYTFADLGSKEFSGHPFVVDRYLVSFAREKVYMVEARSDGAGRSAWRASGSIGGWGTFPVTAAGGCEDLPYILYVITTTPAVERTETVAATSFTEAPCDECLIGRWEATNDSTISFMQATVATGGDDAPTVESVTGILFMEFEANGTGAGGYENFVVHETGLDGNAGSEVFVTFEGFSSGPYTADGSSLIGLSGNTDILVTVKIPGVGSNTVPFGPDDFPVGSAIPTRYSCDGNSLTTWPPIDDAQPIEWIHVSP